MLKSPIKMVTPLNKTYSTRQGKRMDVLMDMIRDLQAENMLLKRTVAQLQERMEKVEEKMDKGYKHLQEGTHKLEVIESKVQTLQENPSKETQEQVCMSSLEEMVSLKMEEVSSSIKEEQMRKEKALNLRIVGLKEEEGEDLESVLSSFFRENMHISEPHWIEASRVGRATQDTTRQVVIKFKDQAQRLKVLKHKQHLKGEKIWINEDLTKEQYLSRRIELDKIKEARNNGMIAYLRNGKAHVGGKQKQQEVKTQWVPKNK